MFALCVEVDQQLDEKELTSGEFTEHRSLGMICWSTEHVLFSGKSITILPTDVASPYLTLHISTGKAQLDSYCLATKNDVKKHVFFEKKDIHVQLST